MFDHNHVQVATLFLFTACSLAWSLHGVKPQNPADIEQLTEQLTIWREAISDTPGIRAVLQNLKPEQHLMIMTVVKNIYPGAILDQRQRKIFESLPFFIKEELWPYVTYATEDRKDT